MAEYVTLSCSCGCGEQFERPLNKVKPGSNYISNQHVGAHRARVYLEDMCGDFMPLMTEYLAHCTRRGLKSVDKVRTSMAPFFCFLTGSPVSLKEFKPGDVDAFLDWADRIDYRSAQHDISVVRTFFAWANQYGHHKGANPVIPKFHAKKRPIHLPRPYSEDEMNFIWKLAADRGSAMVRAIVAIGEEAGLRNGEICRLRLGDLDLTSMTAFVRLPNKSNEEGFVFFHEKTVKYLRAWLIERSDDCGHDHVFYNTRGDPLSPATLQDACARTFCKTANGKARNQTGMDEWCTHRLRHTMASNLASAGAPLSVIMAAGRWKSFSALSHYAKIHLGAARRDYDQAMRRVRAMEDAIPTVINLSGDEFLERCGV